MPQKDGTRQSGETIGPPDGREGFTSPKGFGLCAHRATVRPVRRPPGFPLRPLPQASAAPGRTPSASSGSGPPARPPPPRACPPDPLLRRPPLYAHTSHLSSPGHTRPSPQGFSALGRDLSSLRRPSSGCFDFCSAIKNGCSIFQQFVKVEIHKFFRSERKD